MSIFGLLLFLQFFLFAFLLFCLLFSFFANLADFIFLPHAIIERELSLELTRPINPSVGFIV
jgi:hypothetical protein